MEPRPVRRITLARLILWEKFRTLATLYLSTASTSPLLPLIGTVSATSFSDSTFNGAPTSQAYHVSAVNSLGEVPNAGDVVPLYRVDQPASTANRHCKRN